MLLKSWSYPNLLRWKQLMWVGLGVLWGALAFWYERNVVHLSWYSWLVWVVLLGMGLWEVFTTPLWTLDPSCKLVSRRWLCRFVSWSFDEVSFVFSPFLHKTWQGKSFCSYFFGIEVNNMCWKVGVLSEKDYALLREMARQFHIPIEVRDEVS
ncbi:MAG: hypothetical protein ACK4HQ_00430 [Brevinematales bacterium]